MSRASDIRTYVVAKLSSCTISQMLIVVTKIDDSVNHLVSLHKDRERPPFKVEFANLSFELKGNRLHTKEGIIFSTGSLSGFREVLEIMAGPMNLGDRTFDKLYPPIYSDVLYACSNNQRDMARLIAEIFTGLLKRYQNRSRAGANNDYQFKFKFSDDSRFITVDIKDIKFDDTDHVDFKIQASTEILSNALGGRHRVPMPTKKLGEAYTAKFMESALVEVKTKDTMNTLISGLSKFGLQTSGIVQVMRIFLEWEATPKTTLSIYAGNEVSESYRIVFADSAPDSDIISAVIHYKNISQILGTGFNKAELAADIRSWKELNGPQITETLAFGTAALEMGYSFITPESYKLAIAISDIPNEVSSLHDKFSIVNSDKLLHIRPVGIGATVHVRIYGLTGQGMTTTLGTVSQKDAIEFLGIYTSTVLDDLRSDDRNVNWEAIQTPKLSLWSRIKRFFNAA